MLAVLAVIGVLLALLLPAVQQARGAARRTQCQSNLRQFGLAIHNYHDIYQMFPYGSSPTMYGLSLHATILPYIDQQPLYEAYRSRFPDSQTFSYFDVHNFLSSHSVPMFYCPSDSVAHVSLTNYAGNFGTGVQTYGYNGVFRNPPVKAAEITDGLSNTAAMSEWLLGIEDTRELTRNIWQTPYPLTRPDQLEQFAHLCRETAASGGAVSIPRTSTWSQGGVLLTMYNHVLFPNDASCANGNGGVQEGAYSAASLHHGIVHVLLADGHVRGVSAIIDLTIWRALGSRNGGELPSVP